VKRFRKMLSSFSSLYFVRRLRTSSNVCLKKLPLTEADRGPPQPIPWKGIAILGVAIVAGVNLLFIATEFIPYALKPEFRTVYRESRPQMAERFDSVLRIGQDSVVLNKDVVLEEARKARRQ